MCSVQRGNNVEQSWRGYHMFIICYIHYECKPPTRNFSPFFSWREASLYVSRLHMEVVVEGPPPLKLNKTSSKLYQKPTKLVVFVLKAVCSQPMPSPRLGLLSLDPKSTRCFSLRARETDSWWRGVVFPPPYLAPPTPTSLLWLILTQSVRVSK